MTKKSEMKIKIKYVGPSTIREMDEYTWCPENKYVQDVPVEKAVELLTYPRPDFVLDEDQNVAAAQAAVDEVISPAKGQVKETEE